MENNSYTKYDQMLREQTQIVNMSNPLEIDVLDLLIARGANINYRTELNENILFAVVGDFDLFKYFIDKGADISRRVKSGYDGNGVDTIIDVASKHNSFEVVNFCIDRLGEIKLKGYEIINVVNTLLYKTNLSNTRPLIYKIFDGIDNNCLEFFVHNFKPRQENSCVGLLSNWSNVNRLKTINMPSIGRVYRASPILYIEELNKNSAFLKLEDDDLNTFKKMLKYYVTSQIFFWYIEKNYSNIKDQKILFNIKNNKSISPVNYIFKSLINHKNITSKNFDDAMEKVICILKNKKFNEVLDENIFNVFFEYANKKFDKERIFDGSGNYVDGDIQLSLLKGLDALLEIPNKVSEWDKVSSKSFINKIVSCVKTNQEFTVTRNKVLLSYNMLVNQVNVLSDRKKLKI